MKITKSQLRRIIKEEISKVLDEAPNNAPDADAFRAWLTRASDNITEDNSDDKKESDSKELEPEEALDAADHAVEIVDALKDLISNTLKEVQQQDTFDPSRWWEYEPDEVMSHIYHQQRQIPPTDPKKKAAQWEKIKKQLEERYPRK